MKTLEQLKEERKKRQKESDTSGTSNIEKSSDYDSLEVLKARRAKNKIIDLYTSYAKDTEQFSKDISSRYYDSYGNYIEQYRPDYAEWKTSATDRSSSLKYQSDKIKSMLDTYGMHYDDDFVTQLSTSIVETEKYLDNVVKGATDEYDLFSQGEDKYNAYKNEKKYKDYTYEQLKGEVSNLEMRKIKALNQDEIDEYDKTIDWINTYAGNRSYKTVEEYDNVLSSIEQRLQEINSEYSELAKADYHGDKSVRAKGEQLDRERSTLRSQQIALKQGKKTLEKHIKTYGPIEDTNEAVMGMDDFEEKSVYTPTPDKTEEELIAAGWRKSDTGEWYSWNPGGTYSYTGEDDPIYTYINNLDNVDVTRAIESNNTDYDYLPYNHYLEQGFDQLTEDETKVYNYLYATDREKASEYIQKLKPTLQKRAMERESESYAELAQAAPIIMSAYSLGSNLANSMMFAPKAVATLMGEYDNMPWLDKYGNQTTSVRGTIGADLEEDYGHWANLVYSGGMSIADMLIATGTGYGAASTKEGVKRITQAIMSSSAGSASISEAKNNGASDGKAFVIGLGSAAIEWATEKYSVEKLLNDPKNIGQYLWQNIYTEGLEEGASNVSNVVLDEIVSKVFNDKSEIKNAVDQLVLSGGLSENEALKQVLLDKVKQLGDDVIVGAFSGGAMGGIMLGTGAVGVAMEDAERTKQAGIDITDNNRVGELVNIAKNTGNEKLMKLAEQVAGVKYEGLSEAQKNSYAKKVGKLQSKTLSAQRKSVNNVSKDTLTSIVSEKLKANGIEDSKIAKATDVVVKQILGNDTLTKSQKKIFDDVDGASISNEIENSEEVGNAIDEARHKLFGEALKTASLTTKAESPFSKALSIKKDVSVDGLISESGKTTRASTGEEIVISKSNPIASIKTVNGVRKAFFNTNQGVVESSDITYANETEALIHESFLDMHPSIISTAIKAYDGNIPVQTYIDGMREGILLYGKHNFQEVGKDISIHSDFAKLSSVDQALALKLGRAIANIETTRANKAIANAKEKSSKDIAKKKKTLTTGKVRFENGAKASNHSQKRAVTLAKHLASAIGIDIVFYDSTIEGTYGADANGYFDPNTDTIHLDLQKSKKDSHTIAFTMSHELVHFVKKYSLAKFQVFADFLMEEYAAHGISTTTLLTNKMAELKTDDADYAYEEMIADACERMLLDSNAMLKLAKLKKIDLDLFEKIRLHILDILNKIRAEYKQMNYAPQSEEAKALLKMDDVIGKLYEKFENMVVEAAENFQAIDTDSVKISEDGTIRMQMKQYETTGRDTLLKYLSQQYGNDNASDLIATMDNLYNAMAEIKKDTALSVFGNWQEQDVELDENGHPIFTTSINNGDYVLNQDFSRVCKKRRQLNFVLNMLAEDPAFEASNLTKDDIVKINQAIKKHGFEIACALCFVDSKRFRQTEWADSFANTWNDILYSVVDDKSKLTPFNFATQNPNINDDGIEIDTSKPVMYRKWSDGKEDVKNRRNHDSFDSMLEKKANGKFVEGNANVRAIVKILKENPNLRHTFRGADIIASDGFDTIQRLAPDIRSILDGWGGTSVPKPSSNDAIYDNSVLNISGYNAEKAFAIGGVRMNSFSDFMAHMFFDYAQAFADLSAKGLPMHSYTKELDFARLFGLTRGKINMSAIAAIRENATDLDKIKKKADKETATKWEKSIAGLDISKLADKLGKAETDITYDDVIQNLDECEYVWADESIDVKSATLLQSGIMYDNLTDGQASYCYELIKEGKFDEAFKVAGKENVNKEYAKHLGIITVGVSKAHILKLMRDPTIRMVIPYHKSGLNAQVAKALKILFYEDFTEVQNTMLQKEDGSTVGLSKDGAKIGDKNIRDFNFYNYFGKTIDGVFYDGKATASKYLEWCEKGEYNEETGEYGYFLTDGTFVTKAELDSKGLSVLPKFNEFAEEENYYKLIEDFDCYDTITGEHSPQEAVDFFHDGLPADYKNVLVRALKAEQKVSDDFRDHLDNKGLRDEIMEIVGANGYTPSNNIKKQAKKSDRITIDMSDSERSEILKAKTLVSPIYEGQADEAISVNREKLKSLQIGTVKKALVRIGEEFGVFVDYDINDIEVKITLSKSNLKESITKDATPTQLAKLLPLLKETVGNAIGIESHSNRYYFDTDTVYFENLLGGYIDGEDFVPVRFGLKHSMSGSTTLYVVVDQNKIGKTLLDNKKTEVVKATAPHKVATSASRSVVYNISQIIPFVNSKDVLRYIPDDMLSAEQKKIKWEGIAETIEKTNKKNDKKYFEYISKGLLYEAQQMVIAAAREAGYTTNAWHGSRHEFNVFSKDKRGSNTQTEVSKHWFFAADKETANSYYPYGVIEALQGKEAAEKLKNKGKLYELGIKMENPLVVDVIDYDYASHRENADAWMEYVRQAEENDNDGIILLNALDNQLKTSARESTVYMFKESSQAKSLEVITRDDNDNIIPLSKRFDKSNSDIRFQKKRDYVQTGSKAVMTTERIDYLIEDSGAGRKQDYANYWITSINPTDFIDMTTTPRIQDRAAFDKFPSEWNENSTMDTYDYMGELKKNMRQTPYLAIDITTGEVVGHEGRHRMRALEREGVESVEIRVEFRDEDGRIIKYSPDGERLQIMDIMKITNQFGTKQTATVSNIIPLNLDYRDEILANYGENLAKDGDVRYQKKKLSNRELLSNALESTIDTSTQAGQNEMSVLKEYKENIDKINELESHLAEVKTELYRLSFGKGAKDIARLKKLNEDKVKTSNRINIYDKKLLRIEATKPMNDILAREKEKVRKAEKQKAKETLDKFKEKSNAALRDVMRHNQEVRERNVEGRNKTAMRKKIKGVIGDLDKMLKAGRKKANVKVGMRDTVAQALATAELLFSNNITNEDIVRNGVTSTTSAESTKLNRYMDLLTKREQYLNTIEVMQNASAKANTEGHFQMIDKIDKEIGTLNKELKDVFERERNRLNEVVISSAIQDLADAYKSIKDSEQSYISAAYNEYVYDRLLVLKEDVGGSTIRDMSLFQLQEVYDAYKMVLHVVRTANTLFKEGKMVDATAGDVIDEIKAIAKPRNRNVPMEMLNGFVWSEMKPRTAFEKIGSDTLLKLYDNLRKGEDTFAMDVYEAFEVADKARERHNYKKWDMKSRIDFKLESGKTLSINLQQLMSIYAYSKREQAIKHMTDGGFVFDSKETFAKSKKGIIEMIPSAEVYRLSANDISKITSTLANKYSEAKAYVDEMQKYLTDMGEKGNDVSRLVFGIDLFKEKVYFPLQSSRDYLRSNNDVMDKNNITPSLINSGMTKETIPNARNPIVLTSFDNVWASHTNKMSLYHSFVPALEDFRKVYEYSSSTKGMDDASVRAEIKNVFGENATDYISKFIDDVNGGMPNNEMSNPIMSMFSTFKKTSVGMSLSTVIQQPTAIIRAWAMLNPKYFVGVPHNNLSPAQWDEIKKYAPVAILKEIGGFDAGSGRGMVDYLAGDVNKNWLKKTSATIDDASMYLAGQGDVFGWGIIWNAVKREISNTTNLTEGSEEFLEKCGERFTEVITETQVYDSTFSRSGIMRSKNELNKFATSFMAEPTTSINMLYRAVINAKRGKISKSKATETIASVVLSQFMAGALVSLIYAARDGDDDESYLEKYLESLGGRLRDDINILNMLPYLRDIQSLFDGWDVERPDMAIFADIKKAYDGLQSQTKSPYMKCRDFVAAISNAFGVPLGNAERDLRAIFYNIPKMIFDDEKPTWENTLEAFSDGFTGQETTMKDRAWNAHKKGDTTKVKQTVNEMVDAKVKSGKTEKEARSDIRSSFTSTYKKAYLKALDNKDYNGMNDIRKFLLSTGLCGSLSELDKSLENWRTNR